MEAQRSARRCPSNTAGRQVQPLAASDAQIFAAAAAFDSGPTTRRNSAAPGLPSRTEITGRKPSKTCCHDVPLAETTDRAGIRSSARRRYRRRNRSRSRSIPARGAVPRAARSPLAMRSDGKRSRSFAAPRAMTITDGPCGSCSGGSGEDCAAVDCALPMRPTEPVTSSRLRSRRSRGRAGDRDRTTGCAPCSISRLVSVSSSCARASWVAAACCGVDAARPCAARHVRTGSRAPRTGGRRSRPRPTHPRRTKPRMSICSRSLAEHGSGQGSSARDAAWLRRRAFRRISREMVAGSVRAAARGWRSFGLFHTDRLVYDGAGPPE